jgi:hypothetical protein
MFTSLWGVGAMRIFALVCATLAMAAAGPGAHAQSLTPPDRCIGTPDDPDCPRTLPSNLGATLADRFGTIIGTIGAIFEPAAMAPPPAVANGAGSPPSAVIGGQATRIFAAPHQYPPQDFGAYAILAFRSRATEATRPRHLAICEAYLSTVPHASEAFLPVERQLVTVWPVDDAETVETLATLPVREQCRLAVDRYGLATALSAVRAAGRVTREGPQGVSVRLADDLRDREGPFLFAWNPAGSFDTPDALILRVDLSDVQTQAQAERRFQIWVHEIESHPELWLDGWNEPGLRALIGEKLDLYGDMIVAFVVQRFSR